jgi:aminopeptidase YwaD
MSLVWIVWGNTGIEIMAFNGEDYYSVSGQMDYLRRYGEDFAGMVSAINVDDVGYVSLPL